MGFRLIGLFVSVFLVACQLGYPKLKPYPITYKGYDAREFPDRNQPEHKLLPKPCKTIYFGAPSITRDIGARVENPEATWDECISQLDAYNAAVDDLRKQMAAEKAAEKARIDAERKARLELISRIEARAPKGYEVVTGEDFDAILQEIGMGGTRIDEWKNKILEVYGSVYRVSQASPYMYMMTFSYRPGLFPPLIVKQRGHNILEGNHLVKISDFWEVVGATYYKNVFGATKQAIEVRPWNLKE